MAIWKRKQINDLETLTGIIKTPDYRWVLKYDFSIGFSAQADPARVDLRSPQGRPPASGGLEIAHRVVLRRLSMA